MAVFLSLIFGFLTVEIAMRIFLHRRAEYIDRLREDISRNWGGELRLFDIVKPAADERRVYELFPGANGKFAGQPLLINQAGFRDVTRVVAKPPDTIRLLVLGDSVAFGWGVAQSDRFSDILERALNENRTTESANIQFEVLNFAVPGYNTVMEAATYESAAEQYKPDVLVLSLVTNDDELPNFVRVKPELLSLRTSFLYKAVHDQIVGRVLGDTARVANGGIADADVHMRYKGASGFRADLVPPEYKFLVGWENMVSALGRLCHRVADAHVAPVCLMVSSRFTGGAGQFLPTGENDRWLAVATKSGFVCDDASSATAQFLNERKLQPGNLWVSKQDFHPNPLAHAIIARELYRFLIGQHAIQQANQNEGKASRWFADLIEKQLTGSH